MTRYHVRDILKLELEEIEATFPLCFAIEFDDGEVLDEVLLEETLLSRLFWRLFLPYPQVQIKAKHHLLSVLGIKDGEVGALNSGTLTNLSERILRSIVYEADLYEPIQKEPLLAAIYETISDAQGYLAVMTEEDPISLDLLDFIQLDQDEVIQGFKREAQQDESKISYAFAGILDHIKTAPHLSENNLTKLLRAKLLKENQLAFCVGFIGFMVEADSKIFPKAVWSNYTRGLNGFYEITTDSRKAVRSHLASDSSLQDSEYNARCFQLYSMVLERIKYEPCTPDKLGPWIVKGPIVKPDGVVEYTGDLSRLAGKHYKLSLDDPDFLILEGNEKHLIGRTIWLRTILSCTHSDPHCTCNLCAGEISHNVSRFDNIGHSGTVTVTKVMSQKLLSFKHVIASALGLIVTLNDHEAMFLNTGKENDGLYINKPLKKESIQIVVAQEDVPGLLDLKTVEDINQVTLSRISAIKAIGLTKVYANGAKETHPLSTSVKENAMMLSREFLAYLVEQGWSTDENNNFVFDLANWDYRKRFMVAPNREENVADLIKKVERLVKSNQVLHKQRMLDKDAPWHLLQELFDMVNAEFHINIFCFEVVLYGLMTEGADSLGLSRNKENPVLGISEDLIMYRSLGPAMGFEQHRSTLLNPSYYYCGSRPDSVMDVFVNPQEVIESRYGKQA